MWRISLCALPSSSVLYFLVSTFYSWEVIAAPGSISQSLLLTASMAPPNLYFSLDTSGSMWNILPDDPYDLTDATYDTCPRAITLSNQGIVPIYITRSGGVPYFRVSSGFSNTRYSWGVTSGPGNFRYQKRCFDPNLIYVVRLAGNASGYNGNRAVFFGNSGMGLALYTGHCLNWYFGSSSTAFGDNARRKPNQSSRFQIMQTVLTSLKSVINSLNIGGATPLDTTLSDIGRYFVQGFNNPLKLHPDKPIEADLLEQTYTLSGSNRVMGNNSVTYDAIGGQMGWYISFAGGERIITKAIIRDDIVFFTTLIPDVSSICAIGGSGYVMGVNTANGGQPSTIIFDVDNDRKIDELDNAGGLIIGGLLITDGIPLQPALRLENLYVPTSTGAITPLPVTFNSTIGITKGGRISWQELENNQ